VLWISNLRKRNYFGIVEIGRKLIQKTQSAKFKIEGANFALGAIYGIQNFEF
jgi:hypothetical protein